MKIERFEDGSILVCLDSVEAKGFFDALTARASESTEIENTVKELIEINRKLSVECFERGKTIVYLQNSNKALESALKNLSASESELSNALGALKNTIANAIDIATI